MQFTRFQPKGPVFQPKGPVFQPKGPVFYELIHAEPPDENGMMELLVSPQDELGNSTGELQIITVELIDDPPSSQ